MTNWFVDHLPTIILYAFVGAVGCFIWAVIESLGPQRRAITPATSGLLICTLTLVICIAAFPFASEVKKQTRIERLEKITKNQDRIPVCMSNPPQDCK